MTEAGLFSKMSSNEYIGIIIVWLTSN